MTKVTTDKSPGASPQTLSDIAAAETRLKAMAANLDGRIAALDPKTEIKVLGKTILTGKDIKSLWSKISYVVTDKTYGAGYGGSFDYASSTSHIMHGTVNGWDAHPSGLAFITLHELLHSSKEGERVRQKQWTDYLADCKKRKVKDDKGEHYYGSPFFSEVEEFCYCGSREIMAALGIPPFTGTFDHGFEYGDLSK
jgi:hypothetical protein